MNKLILKVIAISITAMALLTSCDQKESLQQFYVDSSEKDGYITTSIPKSIIKVDASKFTEDSRKAYESIEKVSLVALPVTNSNTALLKTESEKLDRIFENDKYELLMSHRTDGINVRMMFDGTQKSIDEIIVYGNSPEMGLGVARVLGNDMNMNAIMKMMGEIDGDAIRDSGLTGMINGVLLSKQFNSDNDTTE